MDGDDSLMKAYTRAVSGDLEYLRLGLGMQKRESVLYCLFVQLLEAVERDDWTKIFQILRAISKNKVSTAVINFLTSERLKYWMGILKGPPPLEWLNPDTLNEQTTSWLQEVDMKIEEWPSM